MCGKGRKLFPNFQIGKTPSWSNVRYGRQVLRMWIPDVPRGFGLSAKHAFTVQYPSPMYLTMCQELGDGGIVDQVKQPMLRCDAVVGKRGLVVRMGPHADWGGLNDQGVLAQQFWGELGVGEVAA